MMVVVEVVGERILLCWKDEGDDMTLRDRVLAE